MNQTQQLSSEQHLELYYYMQLDRQLEERMTRLFRQNKIVGGLYSSLGQEAVSVGTAYALEARDWLAPMVRNIGALLVKGVPPRDIFTQHMAKATSPTHGRDTTSHFADLKNRHIVAPISMLGDLIPVMTGVAMAGRYLGHKIVAMTWIGDGGSSTGVFHEGMNLAASQKAPLVVVIENNQWAYSTPVSRQVPLRDLSQRALAYGIRGMSVDGNDVVAVYKAAKEAVEQCRAGRGPVLLEAKTMRMKGHAQHDGAEYVPQEMLDYWKARDPLAQYEKFLSANSLWDAAKKAEIDAHIESELDSELQVAEEAPLPRPEEAAQGVYCEGCHTVEAEWQREKAEVTPPAASVAAEWKVTDFGGAIAPAFVPARPSAPTPHPQQPRAPAQQPRPPQQHPTHQQRPPQHAAQHGKPSGPPQQRHQHGGKPKPNYKGGHKDGHKGGGLPAQKFAGQKFAPKQPALVGLPKDVEEEVFEPVVPTEPVSRVPFGRGPKDKAFRQEQQATPSTRDPRHKRGKRR